MYTTHEILVNGDNQEEEGHTQGNGSRMKRGMWDMAGKK